MTKEQKSVLNDLLMRYENSYERLSDFLEELIYDEEEIIENERPIDE
jgi:hypothetical protein